MSTTNTEILKLYKDTRLYNGSRYQVYLNNRTMESYLGTPAYERTVTYKSISEPIELLDPPKNCDEYTYGSITNDGKVYYFFVDNIQSDSYKKTYLNYTIDWWSTNWFNIHCSKAHLMRKPIKPLYMHQPYQPLNTDITTSLISNDACFMATYIPSSENEDSYISKVIMPFFPGMIQLITTGEWYRMFRLPGADIKDCFEVPFFGYDYIKQHTNYVGVLLLKGETEQEIWAHLRSSYVPLFTGGAWTDGKRHLLYNPVTGEKWTYEYSPSEGGIYHYVKYDFFTGPDSDLDSTYEDSFFDYDYLEIYCNYYNDESENHRIIRYMIQDKADTFVSDTKIEKVRPLTRELEVTFKSTDKYKQGIIDWNGNIVWECPYNIEITKFKVSLLIGISHVILQFIPFGNSNGEINTGKGFNYDCRHPGLFVDSYQDYILKNRDYDITMRQIQSDKEVWTQAGATIEGIGYGFAFGQGYGAVAAGVGGALETISRGIINNEFNPKIQKATEFKYSRMTDQISLIGDSITNVSVENQLSKYTLTMDYNSQQRMKSDIENNGYYVDEIVDNLQILFKNTDTYNSDDEFLVKPIFQADNIVIEGSCNVIGKQQVVSRLQNGVEFI